MKVGKLSFLLIGGVIFFVISYTSLLLYLVWPIDELSINKSGVFGDSYGLLTSLFSGLAFAGLIITIVMQKEELKLQREELSLTRDELSGQKEELRVQNETLRQQKFENTFFQMLSLHNEILKSIDIRVNANTEFTGRDAFEEFHRKFRKLEPVRTLENGELGPINAAYLQFYTNIQNEIGHYFRNMYNIIKFVHKSSVADKKLYTNLLRAQLSAFELFFIFYNCLSDMGREKFKPLVEEYSLLKNLPNHLIFKPEHKELYDPRAFKST